MASERITATAIKKKGRHRFRKKSSVIRKRKTANGIPITIRILSRVVEVVKELREEENVDGANHVSPVIHIIMG